MRVGTCRRDLGRVSHETTHIRVLTQHLTKNLNEFMGISPYALIYCSSPPNSQLTPES